MKMKQKILNNMVYIAVVAVLITTTLIGMFTYYRYMEQIKTGMKDEAAYLAASLNFEDQQNLDKYKNITITRITRIAKDGTGKKNPWETIRIVQKSKKHLNMDMGKILVCQ